MKEDLGGDSSVKKALNSQLSTAPPRCFNAWPSSGSLPLQALPPSRDGLVGSWGMLLTHLSLFHHTLTQRQRH